MVEMSHYAPTRDLVVKTGCPKHLSVSPAQKEKASWKHSRGGTILTCHRTASIDVQSEFEHTCSMYHSNKQHIPPSSSCMLAGRAWVKPALTWESFQETACSSIQLHCKITPGSPQPPPTQCTNFQMDFLTDSYIPECHMSLGREISSWLPYMGLISASSAQFSTSWKASPAAWMLCRGASWHSWWER